jgi:hypothetical protein
MDWAFSPLEMPRIVNSHHEAGPQAPKARTISAWGNAPGMHCRETGKRAVSQSHRSLVWISLISPARGLVPNPFSCAWVRHQRMEDCCGTPQLADQFKPRIGDCVTRSPGRGERLVLKPSSVVPPEHYLVDQPTPDLPPRFAGSARRYCLPAPSGLRGCRVQFRDRHWSRSLAVSFLRLLSREGPNGNLLRKPWHRGRCPCKIFSLFVYAYAEQRMDRGCKSLCRHSRKRYHRGHRVRS